MTSSSAACGAPLGAPKGASYVSGSVTRRDFANGYVTVDFANLVGTVVKSP